MGRHKAMPAAGDPQDPRQKVTSTSAGRDDQQSTSRAGDAARANQPRFTARDLSSEQLERYERLRNVTIRGQAGTLRDEAVDASARVWVHTPVHIPAVDAKECQILARFLYSDALPYQYVDIDRACTRANSDRWLESTTASLGLRSRRTYQAVLYSAGRVVHPREFPAPRAVISPRSKGAPAAKPGTAEAMYAITPGLPDPLRVPTLLVLDLASGAGLRPAEIREVTGDDVQVIDRPGGHQLVTVRVRRRGKVDRVVPVIHPAKARRILDRAGQVGSRPMIGLTRDGHVEHNAVNRVSERLVRMGFPKLNAAALRHRYLLDVAVHPGIPAAAMLSLFGVCDMRVLVDRVEQLPRYSAEELADLLDGDQDQLAGGVR